MAVTYSSCPTRLGFLLRALAALPVPIVILAVLVLGLVALSVLLDDIWGFALRRAALFVRGPLLVFILIQTGSA